ncbi:MAG: transcription antitermination factor NusB [Candidatus Improbicoccus devescovinae]|nr:MAG: transcription antitermination factor NusB [Candidatus Improbicoccus devescovinae]
MTRRNARYKIFEALFIYSFDNKEGALIYLNNYIQADVHDPEKIQDIQNIKKNDKFQAFKNSIIQIFNGVLSSIPEIDELITNHTKNRDFNRISKTSLSILRLAIYEILYINSIPIGVSVNEAVEISKKYSNLEESTYINAILASIENLLNMIKKIKR